MAKAPAGVKLCTDYLVVLPSGAIFDDPALRKSVLDALRARFPEYTWEVHSGEVARRRKHFIVLPAPGAVPPSGEAIALSIEALEEINEFLEFQFIEPTKRIN